MKIAVLRHGEERKASCLTEKGKIDAQGAGEQLIQLLDFDKKVEHILFVSSAAGRAIETARELSTGMGVSESPIHSTSLLGEDYNTKDVNIAKALLFIQSLSNPLFLIIIAHQYDIHGIASRLGYKNNFLAERLPRYPDICNLQGPVFDDENPTKLITYLGRTDVLITK